MSDEYPEETSILEMCENWKKDKMTDKLNVDELIEWLDRYYITCPDTMKKNNKIKKLLQQLKAIQESNWQPIETAPRDGSKIDIFIDYDEGGERYPDAYFCKQSKVFCWNIEGTGKRIEFSATPPSHWIAPPINQTKGD
jgi:hypothetical protein